MKAICSSPVSFPQPAAIGNLARPVRVVIENGKTIRIEFVDDGDAAQWLYENDLDVLQHQAASGLDRHAGMAGELAAMDCLSIRETQILELLGTGRTYAETGESLHLSINTVRSHVKKIYGKLAVSSCIEAVNAARQRGLLGNAQNCAALIPAFA